MWSDNESPVDLLRFHYLAQGISDILDNENLLPTTIGVFGDWGSGKSTLLNQVIRNVSERGGTLCLTFNGWLFEGYEDAKSALMGNILDGIHAYAKEHKTLTDAVQETMTGLLGRIDWLQMTKIGVQYGLPSLAVTPLAPLALLGGLAGPLQQLFGKADEAESPHLGLIKGVFKNAPTASEMRRGIREFRRDFQKLLKNAGVRRLVVVIDDLDRCLPPTVIETLEAIKLFLFVENTAFILGADERLVQYAVLQRFPELPNTDLAVGRDYLEKLVQIPVRVPPLNATDTESYLNLLFTQLHCRADVFDGAVEHVRSFKASDLQALAFEPDIARQIHATHGVEFPPELDDDFHMVTRISSILHNGLGGSPRRTKRFLNALLLRVGLARARGLTLNTRVLAKLMLLEYIKIDHFRRLALFPTAPDGSLPALAEAEQAATARMAQGGSGGKEAASAGVQKSEAVRVDSADESLVAWTRDPWLGEWLRLEPPLKDEDLRPYFYIAHDQIRALTASTSKLSPFATNLLRDYISGPLQQRRKALAQVGTLASADASAFLAALTTRLRHADDAQARDVQRLLLDFVKQRTDLLGELLTFYRILPETNVRAATPVDLSQLPEISGQPDFISLIKQWAESTSNPLLASASREFLGQRETN